MSFSFSLASALLEVPLSAIGSVAASSPMRGFTASLALAVAALAYGKSPSHALTIAAFLGFEIRTAYRDNFKGGPLLNYRGRIKKGT